MSAFLNREIGGEEQAAERRQVTALFYDIVGSTKLSVRLDPEDMAELQRSFHLVCRTAITRFEGRLERYMGDGGIALFGFPNAHEDDAERAVRAGLAILAGCEALNQQAPVEGVELAVRVGIATGLVVASALVDRDFLDQFSVAGAPVNLAARLQAAAVPNSVLVSSTTRRLAGEFFWYGPTRELTLSGFDRPQPACRVLAAKPAEHRFAATRSAQLAPLLARERELARILRIAGHAAHGEGHVLVISGEAGIGKSRLAFTAQERLVADQFEGMTFQCSAQYSETPLYPVASHFERVAGIRPGDLYGEVVAKLRELLADSTGDAEVAADFLARLILPPNRTPPERLGGNPALVRHKTLQTLVRRIEALCRERPLLLTFEDVHWIDPTSAELLRLVTERASKLRLLVVVTTRPGHDLAGGIEPTTLALSPLNSRDSAALIRNIMGETELPGEVVQEIVDRADGIPLFLEELTGWMRDGGRTGSAPTAVPASLADSLTARLDRLGPDKRLIQIGSAIGRVFSANLVARIAGIEESRAIELLNKAVDQGLASRVGTGTGQYAFRHALLQEAAYAGMLRERKRGWHRRIAAILDREYAGSRAAAPEILASHYAAAEMFPDAIRCLLEAGRAAVARSANREAEQLLERALRFLARLPGGASRNDLELAIRVALGPALIAVRGPGSPEAQEDYRQAVELCGQLPHGPMHFPAYWGWWRSAPSFKEMHQRVGMLSEFAARSEVDEYRLQAHHCQWATLFMLGRQEACCEHIKKGLAIYESGEYRSLGTLYGGHDPKVCGLGELALSLWLQGRPDSSLRAIEHGLVHARLLRHAGSIAHAKDQEIMLLRYRGDAVEVAESARDMMVFAEEHGLRDLAAKSRIFNGWSLAVLGNAEEGAREIEDGLATQRTIGTQEDFPVYYEMLADAYRRARRPGLGLPLLRDAMRMAESTGLNYWTAELQRQTAELLFLVGDRQGGTALLDVAMATAAEQGARMLLLRAVLTRCRILLEEGRRTEARRSLEATYAQFSEGFDGKDLSEARRLMTELA